jgi:hypothetical protein
MNTEWGYDLSYPLDSYQAGVEGNRERSISGNHKTCFACHFSLYCQEVNFLFDFSSGFIAGPVKVVPGLKVHPKARLNIFIQW